jgi:hypothetical protein
MGMVAGDLNADKSMGLGDEPGAKNSVVLFQSFVAKMADSPRFIGQGQWTLVDVVDVPYNS